MNQGIDWNGIRAAAIAVGIREAARQASANVEEPERTKLVSRILKRSTREKWLAIKEKAVQLASNPALSTKVHSGQEIVANVIAERKTAVRGHLSKYTEDATKQLADSSGSLKHTGPAKDLASVMERLWPQEKGESGLSIQILSMQTNVEL